MRDTHYQKFTVIRTCLADLHAAHPGCPVVDAMHAALLVAAKSHSHMFTDEQYDAIVQPLSGGTKEP